MQEREWRFFITDMIESGEEVLALTDGMDVNEFLNNVPIYRATLWDIRVIGEAARHIPQEVRDVNPHILWHEIIGMRHRLTHAYRSIDVDIVWETIKIHIPKLLVDLRDLLKRIDEGEV